MESFKSKSREGGGWRKLVFGLCVFPLGVSRTGDGPMLTFRGTRKLWCRVGRWLQLEVTITGSEKESEDELEIVDRMTRNQLTSGKLE